MSTQINTTSNTAPKGSAVVTGASAGLGKIYADRLAKRGYDLVLVARRGDKLESVAQSLRAAHGVAVRTLVADLGAAADLDKVISDIVNDESITMLVNNAGTSTLASVAGTSREQLDAMTDVKSLHWPA